jgi:parallel beta-helix repeat protein
VNIAMHTGVGATVINCTASNNFTGFGIYADAGSTLTNCNALGNIGTDTFSCGISTSTGCTVTACTALSNWTNYGTPSVYTGVGFYIGAGNTIQGCTAAHNRGDGIGLIGYSLAKGNSSLENGSSGDGAGIHASSSSNRIEGNNVIGNDRGIDVDGAGNMIVSNSAKLNTVNYKITANNVFGSIVDRTVVTSAAVSGNSAASAAGTVDPWANISY